MATLSPGAMLSQVWSWLTVVAYVLGFIFCAIMFAAMAITLVLYGWSAISAGLAVDASGLLVLGMTASYGLSLYKRRLPVALMLEFAASTLALFTCGFVVSAAQLALARGVPLNGVIGMLTTPEKQAELLFDPSLWPAIMIYFFSNFVWGFCVLCAFYCLRMAGQRRVAAAVVP